MFYGGIKELFITSGLFPLRNVNEFKAASSYPLRSNHTGDSGQKKRPIKPIIGMYNGIPTAYLQGKAAPITSIIPKPALMKTEFMVCKYFHHKLNHKISHPLCNQSL